MQVSQYLASYSSRADSYLARFFATKKKEAGKVDPLAREVIEVFEDYTKGGKKLRGALTVLGYQIAGGKDLEKILPASCAIELFHNFLLIHDDVIDRDKLRRGKPTVHELYIGLHKARYAKGDSGHYGVSMAIVAGDIGAFLAYELLASTPVAHERRDMATKLLNEFLTKTFYGQVFDITFDFKKKVSWDEVLLVRTYKTAYYGFVMPLSVGMVLGGAREGALQPIEEYGIRVGLAFHLQDDILGLFGQEKVTGKSAESDIREGKKTLLYTKALEFTKGEERKYLLEHYGREGVTASQIGKIKRIIKKSGALGYSQSLSLDLVTKAKKAVPRITKNKTYAGVLSSLADFVVEREK